VVASTDVAVLAMKPNMYSIGVQLRYNYRLDPWPRHRIAFGKAFGCARVVFNDALAAHEAAHQAGQPYLTDADLSARLTAAKKTPGRAWLAEVSAVVLQAGPRGLGHRLPELFRVHRGQAKRPEDSEAAVTVP
jgi:putative transposase